MLVATDLFRLSLALFRMCFVPWLPTCSRSTQIVRTTMKCTSLPPDTAVGADLGFPRLGKNGNSFTAARCRQRGTRCSPSPDFVSQERKRLFVQAIID